MESLYDVNKQSHLIFGAGLIGSFVGGVLHHLGASTTFVARGKALERLKEPLTISCVGGEQVCISELEVLEKNPIAEAMHLKRHYDLIWLTTKAVNIESALVELKPFVSRDSLIICCQNGIGSTETVKSFFPENTVLKAVVVFNVAEVNPHHLHRSTEGDVLIEQHSLLKDHFDEQINTPLCPIRLHDNIEGVVWAKLQLNLINALNAVSNQPIKVMLRNQAYRRFYANMLTELPQVAKAKGIKLEQLLQVPAWILPWILRLPEFLYRLIENSVVKMDETARSSMWWDITEGRHTEIDFLQGALLREAKSQGVDCPYNRRVFNTLQALETKRLAWEDAGNALLKND